MSVQLPQNVAFLPSRFEGSAVKPTKSQQQFEFWQKKIFPSFLLAEMVSEPRRRLGGSHCYFALVVY